MRDSFDETFDSATFQVGPATSIINTATGTNSPIVRQVHTAAFGLPDLVSYLEVVNSDIALDVNPAVADHGGFVLDVNRYIAVNNAGPNTIKVTLNRPFTGQIRVRLGGRDGVFTSGGTISNASEEFLYTISSMTNNGDLTYTHTLQFLDGLLAFYGKDVRTFFFDVEFINDSTADTLFTVEFLETEVTFIREFINTNGVISSVDYLADGTPYTVQGIESIVGFSDGDINRSSQSLVMEDYYPETPVTLNREDGVLNLDTLLFNTHTSTVGGDIIQKTSSPSGNNPFPSGSKITQFLTGVSKWRVDFNRAFTGRVLLTIEDNSSTVGNLIGQVSENLNIPSTLTNATDEGDGWYSQTNNTLVATVTYDVEDCHYFTFFTDLKSGSPTARTFSVSLQETKTRFIREYNNDGGTITTSDLKFDGTPYTVLGNVTAWDNADTSLPYSEEVIGVRPYTVVKMKDSHLETPTIFTPGTYSELYPAFPGFGQDITNTHTSNLSQDITHILHTGRFSPSNSIYGQGGSLTGAEVVITNSLQNHLIHLNRPFTGWIKIGLPDPGGLTITRIGFFSKNINAITSTLRGTTNVTISNGWYTNTADALTSFYVYADNIKEWSFWTDSDMGVTANRNLTIEYQETETTFYRQFFNYGGTVTYSDINENGEPYTVIGSESEYGNDDNVIPSPKHQYLAETGSGSVEGTISTGGTTSIVATGFTSTVHVRKINIQVRENVKVLIDIVLYDNETYRHIIYGGSYSDVIPLNRAAIKSITVTATEATASDVVINYSSETRF
jgi:hypothetical protein